MDKDTSLNSKNNIIRIILLILSLLGVVLVLALDNSQNNLQSNLLIKTEDKSIIITREGLDKSSLLNCVITIKDSDEKVVYSEKMTFFKKQYVFEQGEHGKKYYISIDDGITGKNYLVAERMFVDYSKVSKLAILDIATADNKDPYYEEAESVEGVWGRTITNNEYSMATLNLIRGSKEKSLTTKVKVRGNTSALLEEKIPYRLKLDKKTDFGYFDNSSKNWVLLSVGSDLKTILGYSICKSLDMDWIPKLMPVNVILNGDWKGTFYLIEAVERKASDDLVSKDGYVFENDAYWWNAGDAYIKTSKQPYPLGYTFVYPEIKNGEQMEAVKLKNYLEEVEELVHNHDEAYSEYIDTRSWAQWIMVRDIIGNADAGGTNMYYYIRDFDTNNSDKKRICMGPLWDFDAAMRVKEDWSACRYMEGNLFPELFEMDSFNQEYKEIWDLHKDDLIPGLEKKFSKLDEKYGDSYAESIVIDQTRWDKEIVTYDEQKAILVDWMDSRIAWMDNELSK